MTTEAKRILMFDDDYESMAPLKELLEYAWGYSVELTADVDILDRLRNVKYDLICADAMIHPESLDGDGQVVKNVHFDGVNWQRTGLEFLMRLRRGELTRNDDLGTDKETPAIVLSAVADLSDFDEKLAEWRHNTRRMEKPFDTEELIAVISDLLRGNPS